MPLMGRVDDEIRKVLNEIIAHELKDPRLQTLVSVTDVQTTKDLKNAKVFVSVLEESMSKDALKVLNSASAFIRGLLFDRLRIRMVPYLTFLPDTSFARGAKIEGIIKQMRENGEIPDGEGDEE